MTTPRRINSFKLGKVFSFFSRLFQHKSLKPVEKDDSAPVDYSLRPNPDTYLDQYSETATILNRIGKSSSSVIGIAGVRGAGKSSLALKILKSSNDAHYFTLLIHSPTGYEPRDFLLSVFQRICEATIARLERLFGQEQSMEGRGQAELRRSRLTAILLVLGAFAILVVPVGYGYYRYITFQKARWGDRKQYLELQRQKVESKRQQLTTEIEKRFTDANSGLNLLRSCISGPARCRDLYRENLGLSGSRKDQLTDLLEGRFRDEVFRRGERVLERNQPYSNGPRDIDYLSPDAERLISGLNEINFLAQQFLMSEEEIKFVVPRTSKDDLRQLAGYLGETASLLKSALEHYKQATLREIFLEEPGATYLWELLPLVAMSLVAYSTVTGIVLAGRRVQRRVNLQKKYPPETGLYYLAKETLEHLKYQTTMTSSNDTSVTLWKLASKFVRTKQLETRPISMPGLTADCNAFINNMAEVFGGKSVICLDELDKIIDTKQLEELLTGVKGILGQNNSHFLLTVSEDALARFATRRRAERDILESSFDEIISLNRVDFRVARHIVTKMLELSDQFASSDHFNKNVLIVWIFGSGIPREIKRNVVIASEGFDFVSGEPRQLWRLLFLALIESLKSWALIASAQKDISYSFLFCLEGTKELQQGSTENPQRWYEALVALWSKHHKLAFADPTCEVSPSEGGADVQNESFQRGIFELLIGAYALLLLTDEQSSIETIPTDRLLDVFTLLAYSPSFASLKFRSLLEKAGVLTT